MHLRILSLCAVVTVIKSCCDPKQAQELLAGKWVNIGSIEGSVRIGSVPNAYNKQTNIDRTATNNAKHFLESARKMFPTGVYRMPALDPFMRRQAKPFQVTDDNVQGSLHLTEVVVRGAKEFRLDHLRLRVEYPRADTYRLDYNVTLPKLGYKCNFKTKLHVNGSPLNLEGSIQLVLNKLTATGILGSVLLPHEGFLPDMVEANAIQGWGHSPKVTIKVKIDNSGASSSDIQSIAHVLHLLKAEFSIAVGKEIMYIMNRVLKGFTLQQLEIALINDSNKL